MEALSSCFLLFLPFNRICHSIMGRTMECNGIYAMLVCRIRSQHTIETAKWEIIALKYQEVCHLFIIIRVRKQWGNMRPVTRLKYLNAIGNYGFLLWIMKNMVEWRGMNGMLLLLLELLTKCFGLKMVLAWAQRSSTFRWTRKNKFDTYLIAMPISSIRRRFSFTKSIRWASQICPSTRQLLRFSHFHALIASISNFKQR